MHALRRPRTHTNLGLGYITRRQAIEAKYKRPRGTYRIADPFFRFWFRYVFPNRSRLDRGRTHDVLSEIEADLDTFMGLAFEDCCRDWLGRHAPVPRFPTSERLGSWWARDRQKEIDIAAISRGRYELLGSCKWSRTATNGALTDLLAARDHLGSHAANAHLVIFARGFNRELAQRGSQQHLTLVPAAELFS